MCHLAALLKAACLLHCVPPCRRAGEQPLFRGVFRAACGRQAVPARRRRPAASVGRPMRHVGPRVPVGLGPELPHPHRPGLPAKVPVCGQAALAQQRVRAVPPLLRHLPPPLLRRGLPGEARQGRGGCFRLGREFCHGRVWRHLRLPLTVPVGAGVGPRGAQRRQHCPQRRRGPHPLQLVALAARCHRVERGLRRARDEALPTGAAAGGVRAHGRR